MSIESCGRANRNTIQAETGVTVGGSQALFKAEQRVALVTGLTGASLYVGRWMRSLWESVVLKAPRGT